MKKDRVQFKEATKQLKQQIIDNPELEKRFTTKDQLVAIDKERKKIPGFTWHHHQEKGILQLVPTEVHSETGILEDVISGAGEKNIGR
ncbi:HNH endonuclease [Mechercharimyces sp. CAU 1602]|uniref:HNH endonuclease n=1 Tax=Mechercharimyces sp. CAU 1602 TaxID=2973933 RepID=UPI00216324EF|nr:HNH endonuclease [Mechercharimyces sp. CAU 1602]MCS1350752.1 HNH endonuclease [Mechercharimyces sp. CAU 1602]